MSEEFASIIGLCRIAFGLMFIIKLYFTLEAKQVAWAHRRPFAQYPVVFTALLALFALSVVCVTLGLFSTPMCLLCWILYVYLFHYVSVYGMEDTVFQSFILYLSLADSGKAYSLDAMFSLGSWGRIPADSYLPEIALSLILGLIFFSAGISKLKSPMWRRGLGFYFFCLLPLHRRIDLSGLCKLRTLMFISNYAVIALQLAVLPAFLLNATPLGITVALGLFVFAVSLSTIFVFTWLGEGLMLSLLPVLYFLWSIDSTGLWQGMLIEIQKANTLGDALVVYAIGLTLLAGAWSACYLHFPNSFAALSRLNGWFRRISRYTWGLGPVELFTERHMQGPVVYRVFAEDDEAKQHSVFEVFNVNCQVGGDRILRPTLHEVTQYKVAEALEELDAFGNIQTPAREKFITALAGYIRERAYRKLKVQPNELVFKIVQLIPPSRYVGASSWYLDEPWVDAFKVTFSDAAPPLITPLNKPILKGPTGRDISRLSFTFDAELL